MEKARVLRKAFYNFEPQEQDIGAQAYEKEPQAARQPSVLLRQKTVLCGRFFFARPAFYLTKAQKNTENLV